MNKKIKCRLFYGVIQKSRVRSGSFYYTKESVREDREVARGLLLFTRDFFKLNAELFCFSDCATECLQGQWYFDKRSFITEDKKKGK